MTILINKKKLFFLALFLGTLLVVKASEKLLKENTFIEEQ